MPRLYRPPIPLEVRCRVALKAHGTMWPDDLIAEVKKARGLGKWLSGMLAELAGLLGCEVRDLRLDHDPPLALRKRKGDGNKTIYSPPANDVEFLFYRPHGAQFAGSHDIKTRVRGDHGQYSDLALIKRERRRNKRNKKGDKKRRKWRSAPLRGANRWPPKGSRKMNWSKRR